MKDQRIETMTQICKKFVMSSALDAQFYSLADTRPKCALAGIVAFDGLNITMTKICHTDKVVLPCDIERNGMPFYKYPRYFESQLDGWMLPLPADIFEAFRRFFNVGQQKYTEFKVLSQAICCFSICTSEIVQIDESSAVTDSILRVVHNLRIIADKIYLKIVTNALGDNGFLEEQYCDTPIYVSQYELFKNDEILKTFNDDLNVEVQKFFPTISVSMDVYYRNYSVHVPDE